jgi:hypothetical protein
LNGRDNDHLEDPDRGDKKISFHDPTFSELTRETWHFVADV